MDRSSASSLLFKSKASTLTAVSNESAATGAKEKPPQEGSMLLSNPSLPPNHDVYRCNRRRNCDKTGPRLIGLES